MVITEEQIPNILVVKRDGKKVDFNGSKVAMAIKKGFDSVIDEDSEDKEKYTTKDIQKVYQGVLKRINKEFSEEEKIKIEVIQDLIEEELKKQGYEDVYSSFSEYRERRANSRKLFADEKQLHKFLKTIESLGLKSAKEEDSKRENAKIAAVGKCKPLHRQEDVSRGKYYD